MTRAPQGSSAPSLWVPQQLSVQNNNKDGAGGGVGGRQCTITVPSTWLHCSIRGATIKWRTEDSTTRFASGQTEEDTKETATPTSTFTRRSVPLTVNFRRNAVAPGTRQSQGSSSIPPTPPPPPSPPPPPPLPPAVGAPAAFPVGPSGLSRKSSATPASSCPEGSFTVALHLRRKRRLSPTCRCVCVFMGDIIVVQCVCTEAREAPLPRPLGSASRA